MKFGINFENWLKKKGYTFKLASWCPYCVEFKSLFREPDKLPLYKGQKRKMSVPAVFVNNKIKDGDWRQILKNEHKNFKTLHKKSSFGVGKPRNWKASLTKPSGTYRSPGSRDYIPQPGKWGAFSASPGLNRAGNAISCRKSANWLYEDRSPSLAFGSLAKQAGREMALVKQAGHPLLYTVSPSNRRGENGFDRVPESIYDTSSVLRYSYSPYTGARMPGILPRPYGPIDTAALKGYPNDPRLKGNVDVQKYYKKYPNHFGRRRKKIRRDSHFGEFGPYINQAYMPREEYLDYGPYINQAYMSNFGLQEKPLFRPHFNRNFRPSYASYANKDLYLNDWNPYQIDERTPKQRLISKNSKAINQRYQLNRYGSTDTMMGPNNVAYRNPMLMYPGAGANTINYLTGRNYLKPCRGKDTSLKVRKNNNPTGFLASDRTVPISGTKFGQWAYPNNPWNSEIINTNFAGPRDGAGFTRIGQPMELYNYQNTPYGSDKYPEFLGPRAWYGGFGNAKRPSRKTSHSRKKVKPGDTVQIKNGKIKVVKKRS
jgi:hypothetical protein